MTINGGSIYCYSSNNDAIDSNSTLTITGGLIIAAGTTAPEGGFDCDNNTFKITGGTLLGIGGSTSTPSSSSTQRSVIYNGSANAATLITFINADSKAIMTYDVPKQYSQMVMLYSSSSLESSKTYTIYTGGSFTGGTTFHGFTTGQTYTSGSKATTFTTSSIVTTVGTTTGGNTPGGGGRF